MTLGAVAISIYGATGSLWIAVAWTIVALVLLQAAYFVLVLGLVYWSRDGDQASEAGPNEPASHLA
ncbi:exopolysaccharide production repressor protein [Mesorhizobium sp. VK9D]|uniref:exopolysaccharide production repressor protein n=1 Tax=Mesorhizobium australafricanum TaxID=3072311 RepID=UPI002A23ADD0|nr:exopolysaccharide production repressor protein [Mesorhizobium sp. VK9D]MDX8454929.1 exopolysaccharide production repressor protein [Mesorhizobium sp. VK9D]